MFRRVVLYTGVWRGRHRKGIRRRRRRSTTPDYAATATASTTGIIKITRGRKLTFIGLSSSIIRRRRQWACRDSQWLQHTRLRNCDVRVSYAYTVQPKPNPTACTPVWAPRRSGDEFATAMISHRRVRDFTVWTTLCQSRVLALA